VARRDAPRVHRPTRSAWTWLRAKFNLSPRIIDGWNDLTRRMEPPDGALERFTQLHPEVSADRVPLVWEAFEQWVRVYGRREVSVFQPSLAVDDPWQQLADDRLTWRHLPEQVQAMQRLSVRDHQSRSNLSGTHEQAHWDEFVGRLPLLFLVDEVIGISDGRLYQGECTVEDCKDRSALGKDPQPGRTCLHGTPWVPSVGVQGAAP
jgi:hypothetical protein